MASFRIHEDQENTALALRKEADVFSAATQRRALGDLSQFACNQNRNIKHVSLFVVFTVTNDKEPSSFTFYIILGRINEWTLQSSRWE